MAQGKRTAFEADQFIIPLDSMPRRIMSSSAVVPIVPTEVDMLKVTRSCSDDSGSDEDTCSPKTSRSWGSRCSRSSRLSAVRSRASSIGSLAKRIASKSRKLLNSSDEMDPAQYIWWNAVSQEASFRGLQQFS